MAYQFPTARTSVSALPTSAFPTDARYYFTTKAEADTAASQAVAAGSTDGIYFIGMNLAVVTSTTATLYIITPSKTLSEVGAISRTEFDTAVSNLQSQINAIKTSLESLELIKISTADANGYPNIAEADRKENVLYLVPSSDADTANQFNEYLWVSGSWELIGNMKVEVDLSGYVKTSDVNKEDYSLDNYETYTSDENPASVKFVQGAVDETLNAVNEILQGLINGTA